jgi:hypothetical protein
MAATIRQLIRASPAYRVGSAHKPTETASPGVGQVAGDGQPVPAVVAAAAQDQGAEWVAVAGAAAGVRPYGSASGRGEGRADAVGRPAGGVLHQDDPGYAVLRRRDRVDPRTCSRVKAFTSPPAGKQAFTSPPYPAFPSYPSAHRRRHGGQPHRSEGSCLDDIVGLVPQTNRHFAAAAVAIGGMLNRATAATKTYTGGAAQNGTSYLTKTNSDVGSIAGSAVPATAACSRAPTERPTTSRPRHRR